MVTTTAGSEGPGLRVLKEVSMTLAIDWVIVDCEDVEKMSAFWSAALDLEPFVPVRVAPPVRCEGRFEAPAGYVPGQRGEGRKNGAHFSAGGPGR